MRLPVMTVLYEDQIAVQPTSYGPHMLVLTCVADRVGGDPWALRARVVGIAKKGDAILHRARAADAGVRASILRAVPSFERLVRTVQARLGA